MAEAPIKKGRVRSSTTTSNSVGRADLNFSVVPADRTSIVDDDGAAISLRRYGALNDLGGLNDLLATRPDKGELIRTNILKGSDISGKLVAAQDSLRSQLVEDALKKKMSVRRGPDEIQSILVGEAPLVEENEN